MSPGSNTESYPAFARIGLRENPGKNLNQITYPDWDSNSGHLVSRPDALTVTPQAWTSYLASECDEGDNAGEMSPESSTESYPAFAHIGLSENPGKKPHQVVVITEDVQNVHLLLEYRPHIDVSLTCEHDPKLQEYCVCPQNMPQFDSEGIPNQAPETNKRMILNGPTSRNREGSDQYWLERARKLQFLRKDQKVLPANRDYKEWTLRVGTFDVAGPISMTFKPAKASDSAFSLELALTSHQLAVDTAEI
ncbi:hypothetical protein ANN_05598 [Periplaneta americana]|uniref:Uncharacterized protein n=1 Tax=Periplaneta americana TaxID=6978 RepID=A0ABQ8TB90_PERAM|nr:hypothetical protein ANN_05598 [Periplaneta americana]